MICKDEVIELSGQSDEGKGRILPPEDACVHVCGLHDIFLGVTLDIYK